MVASILGYEKIVKRLLEYKNNGLFCNYNLTDNNGNTALLLASEHVNIEVFGILFKHNVKEIKKTKTIENVNKSKKHRITRFHGVFFRLFRFF